MDINEKRRTTDLWICDVYVYVHKDKPDENQEEVVMLDGV